ncbi:hypothetical protein [Sinobaca sp. H24]|uniref:hypothetical protein n=1 Tax=Sinobaca sp. H24 TaxID=2923376 RepID=UPI0035B2072C
MYDFLQKFEPFIQKSLSQTKPQNREDLRQDLRLKCMECVHRFEPGRTPGIFRICQHTRTQSKITAESGFLIAISFFTRNRTYYMSYMSI